MSEFGCTDNPPRTFGEIESLYSKNMTSVYSGGLVYEYTEEVNKFGLVKVQGNDVKELPDFAAFKSALAKTPAPSDDGGYRLDGKPSDCPAKSEIWLVRNNSIPIMPSEAEKYFKMVRDLELVLRRETKEVSGQESLAADGRIQKM
jgi:hypothetical protein